MWLLLFCEAFDIICEKLFTPIEQLFELIVVALLNAAALLLLLLLLLDELVLTVLLELELVGF